MRDRLMQGALAGAIAQIWIFAINNTSYYLLRFAKSQWVNTISSLMWGHLARNPIEWVLAEIVQWVLASFLGALYARFALPEPGSGSYIGRSVGISLAAYLALTAFATVSKIPNAYYKEWPTVVTRLVAIVGYGVILGWLMRRWDQASSKARN